MEICNQLEISAERSGRTQKVVLYEAGGVKGIGFGREEEGMKMNN